MYLKCLVDGNTPTIYEIPFDGRVGNAIVGTDTAGRRYVSSIVETRVGGF